MKNKITEWTNFVSFWLYPTILIVFLFSSKKAKQYYNWVEKNYPSSF
jgi:hypothetical protein